MSLQRFTAHSQLQRTAVHYILMREEWSLQLIAVQHNAPHILVIAAVVVGYHLERLAVFQMNGRLVEQRASDGIYRLAGAYLIEAIAFRMYHADICPQSSLPESPSGLLK